MWPSFSESCSWDSAVRVLTAATQKQETVREEDPVESCELFW